MQSTDNMEILELLRKHTREELGRILEFTEDNLNVRLPPSCTKTCADCVVQWVP